MSRKPEQGKSVIIVESPAKTRTLGNFLGKDFDILASMGHVRDLPEKKLGVDIDDSFKPTYVIITRRRSTITEIRQAVKKAKEVFFASDPDREGEAIAWHLAEVLKIPNPQRLEFHEITAAAVKAALEHPRPMDMKLVDAQQARRVLDRIVGYTISPLLNRRSAGRARSAGRVQSVAVRLVVNREREIQAFVPQESWSVEASLAVDKEAEPFSAKLVRKSGEKIDLQDEKSARAAVEDIQSQTFLVKGIKNSSQLRNPPAPFTTSTLQQDASARLSLSPRRTMRLAQQLYEGVEIGGEGHTGLITYMRTDAVRISPQAQAQAREYITKNFGDEYLPAKPRAYKARKGAQEAHEAIRPTSVDRRPEDLESYLDEAQLRLYRLIWSRFMASQMASVRLALRNVDISAGDWDFETKEVKVAFPGFSVVYPIRDKEAPLPPLVEGQELILVSLDPKQHFTEPPPRFSEASLVKELEANGIGRPSTYAPILATIQDRGYVYLNGKRRLRPTDLGFAVTDKLVEHFPDIMEVKFTAEVEQDLDKIEEGEADWQEVLKEFYGPFAAALEAAKEGMGTIRLPGQPTDEVCEKCGKPMVQRTARTGSFLACSGYPECKNTRPIADPEDSPQKDCDKCGKPMLMRRSRYGPFWGCSGYPECTNTVRIRSSYRRKSAPRKKSKAAPKAS
ncbi:MAG: type I DNA topoisomerase [Armatimonadetes bacterium]|nr:type I DNA topoisomerase [Armatimonadota bacterium]NIM24952.1 type I DNA topoisomerase [Armatimonadota bacterium]NIM68838.1 type I DNA topoisomerase [Armatimonadota bacterium]NIM76664.1 type I DNA topoisomerase [Armatimonadota bacterium]NIN07043.1 type I DNA topoisomerase [Armatimonadota bacterium]